MGTVTFDPVDILRETLQEIRDVLGESARGLVVERVVLVFSLSESSSATGREGFVLRL
jgi:hypothetical protein